MDNKIIFPDDSGLSSIHQSRLTGVLYHVPANLIGIDKKGQEELVELVAERWGERRFGVLSPRLSPSKEHDSYKLADFSDILIRDDNYWLRFVLSNDPEVEFHFDKDKKYGGLWVTPPRKKGRVLRYSFKLELPYQKMETRIF